MSPSPGADRAPLRLGRRATDTVPTLLVGLAWSLAWYLPWQGWLEAFPWCRVALALVLFIVPGAWLVRALAPEGLMLSTSCRTEADARDLLREVERETASH